MLGYSDMKEVLLWVQTEKAAKVKFCYWDKEVPAIKYFTDEASTSKNTAFVTKQIADQVQPSKKYGYEVYVNNKKVVRNYPMEFQTQTLWQFRTDPPAFKFAVGSCTYTNETDVDRPGTPYGKDISIFEKIYDQKVTLNIIDEDKKAKTYNFEITKDKSRIEISGLKRGLYTYSASSNIQGKNQTSLGQFLVTKQDLKV